MPHHFNKSTNFNIINPCSVQFQISFGNWIGGSARAFTRQKLSNFIIFGNSLSLSLFLFLSPSEIWSSLFIIISHHYGYLISFYFLKISQDNTSALFLFHLSLPIRLSHCHCHHMNFGFWLWMWATQVINLLIILLDKFEVF